MLRSLTLFALALTSVTCAIGCGSSPPPLTVISTALLAQDSATAQSRHDAIFGGLKGEASRLGDLAHAIFVDAASSTNVVSVDLWSTKQGFDEFVAEPSVSEQDATLFATPPDVAIVSLRSGWTMWGTFSREGPDGHSVNIALIRGKLAAGEEDSRAVHNQGAGQAKATAQQLGDLAHQVYLDPSDPSAFLVIDVWTSLDGAQKLYSSPGLQASFGQLLAGPPTVTLYAGTDWVQW
jgi:quinol monooxygenase YgiN